MNQKVPSEELTTQNIFDELSESQNIWEEVLQMEEKQRRDFYYYLAKLNKSFLFINIFISIFIAFSAVYIYVQSKDTRIELSFLAPVCELFLWSQEITPNTCFGITPVLEEYQWNLDQETQKQWESLIQLVGDVYAIENSHLSRPTVFLLEKTQDRLRPLEILREFDELKNTFAPIDTSEISCYDLVMSSDRIFSLTCDAFSSDWDTSIANFSEWKLSYVSSGGTSISRASSFMDFIDSYSDSPFRVREKPKTLTSDAIQNGPYTQRTSFSMELEYNNISNLSL